MMRPLTFVSMLLAAGSGLYLYQAKQQARVLDRQIADMRTEAGALHQRAEVLRAEYTLLNDPTRLGGLAAQYLPDLKPTQPGQWTSMAELDKRLPPIGEATVTPAPLEPPVAAPAPLAAPAAPPMAAAQPPQPAQAASKPPATRPPAIAHVAAPHPIVAQLHDPAATAHRAAPQPIAERLPTPSRLVSRSVPPTVPTTSVIATLRPMPAQAPTERPAVPVVASALGMARTMLAPVTPADATPLAPMRDGITR